MHNVEAHSIVLVSDTGHLVRVSPKNTSASKLTQFPIMNNCGRKSLVTGYYTYCISESGAYYLNLTQLLISGTCIKKLTGKIL
jgi:hypothetical protein